YLPDQLNSDGSLVLGADGAPSHGALVATNVVQSGAVDVERIAADNLGPMYSDEFTLGYESQFSDRLKGGVRFVYRDLKQSIEDSDLGPVVAQWLAQNNIANNANEYYFYTLINPGKNVTFHYDFDLDGTKETVALSADDLR